ncbi:MAG: endonuclease III [Bryobacterales bacterium]|nr:endonuclease III [Bryobacterales bacterium]
MNCEQRRRDQRGTLRHEPAQRGEQQQHGDDVQSQIDGVEAGDAPGLAIQPEGPPCEWPGPFEPDSDPAGGRAQDRIFQERAVVELKGRAQSPAESRQRQCCEKERNAQGDAIIRVFPIPLSAPSQKISKPRTAADRKARLAKILALLDEMFPNVTCALHHRNPWELLVATILSAQCTDKRVNEVTPGLFAKYPTPEDFAAVRPEVLAEDIRSTGFFNNKAKSVVGAANRVVTEFGGEVPRTIEELLTIPGAARKTANVVLGTAYGIASGVVVDTHVQRIARRLDLTREDEPVKIERDLMKILPREKWILFAHQLIHHGRSLCVARRPRCAECPLELLCYAKDKTV